MRRCAAVAQLPMQHEIEGLACLGERWADDGDRVVAMDEATAVKTVLDMPVGRLLAWLVGSGAAGVLAGGLSVRRWWCKMQPAVEVAAVPAVVHPNGELKQMVTDLVKQQTDFCACVRTQHEMHTRQLERHTQILDNVSQTLVAIKTLEEHRRA